MITHKNASEIHVNSKVITYRVYVVTFGVFILKCAFIVAVPLGAFSIKFMTPICAVAVLAKV